MACRETEIKICDISDIIKNMCPVEIYVNNKLEWTDDVDITGMSEEESYKICKKITADFNEFIKKKTLIESIKFDIVDYHHSIIHIETR